MSKIKENLKKHIAFTPRERRLELEEIIDKNISSADIEKALAYINELDKCGHSHDIVEIGYSENGVFYIKTQTGMAFLN